MDRDTSPDASNLDGSPKFSPNDYVDAQNMRVLSSDPTKSGGRSAATGNEYAGRAGTVELSDKGIRIFYEFTEGNDIFLHTTIYNEDGTLVYEQFGSTTFNSATYEDVDQYLIDRFADALLTITDSHNTGENWSDITVTDYNGGGPIGWTITLEIDNLTTGLADQIQETLVLTEYIPESLTGTLQPIGSVERNGDTFIFWANKAEDGVGEIGVMTYDGNYSYTRLIRSKNLKYGWYHLIDSDCEINGDKVSIYYTDNYNVYRSFYYNGVYVQDGAMKVNNPLNFYDLDEIALQSMLQPQAPYTSISFGSQTQTGGGLISGNKRYSAVYVTAFGTETEPSPLSNVIPVYSANTATPTSLSGDLDGTVTPKINNIVLSGVNSLVFPKVKIIAAEYYDTTVTFKVIGTFDTSISPYEVSHTGLEIGESVTVSAVQSVTAEVLKGLNIRIVDTRLVRSNYEIRPNYDLTAFAQALTLTTKIKQVASEGDLIDSLGNGMVSAGYFIGDNAMMFAGYMDNETYRFGVRVKWLNGGYSQVYWIADKQIIPSEDTVNFAVNGVSLTTAHADGAKLLIRYLEVGNISTALTLLPAEINVADIEGFEIVRAECVPEVIASGVMNSTYVINQGGTLYAIPFYYNTDENGLGIGAYKFSGDSYLLNAFFPNLILDNDTITFKLGDKIYYQNTQVQLVDFDNSSYDNTQTVKSPLNQNNGWTGAGNGYANVDVENLVFTDSYKNDPVRNADGGYGNSTNKTVSTNTALGPFTYEANFLTRARDTMNNPYFYWNRLGVYSPLISISSPLTNTVSGSLTPYIVQYFRPLTNKYGNPNQTTYIPTGCFFTSQDTTADVYGGDTTIEKTCIKLGINDESGGSNFFNVIGGLTFFSQNRIHAQMRNGAGGTGAYTYPFQLPSSGTWANQVGAWLEQPSQEALSYSQSYTIRNNENSFAPYDTSITYYYKFPTRIDWSDSKPVGSLIDYYSIFRPLNYRDLSLRYGEIIHMDTAQGELVTWQNYQRFMRQYFNNDAVLNTLDTATVLIGDGSVMSRRGTEISNIGATHKWGVCRGRSKGGNDVFTWWNQKLGLYVRFGYDGTIVLSDDANFRRELIYSTQSITNFSKSVMDWGDCVFSVWDDQYKEFLLTFRNYLFYPPWANDVTYNAGDIVTQGTDGTYYGIPIYWKAKVANIDIDPSSPYVPNVVWERDTSPEVITYYTLAFNELTNRFTTYYGYVPKLYMRWQNTYYTACPINYTESASSLAYDRVYSHLKGEICEWWEGVSHRITSDIDEVAADGYSFTTLTSIPYMSGLPLQTWVLIVKYTTSPDEFRYNILSYDGTTVTLETPITTDTRVYVDIAPAFVYQPTITYMANQYPLLSKRPQAIKMATDEKPLEVWGYTDGQETFMKSRYPAGLSTPVPITVTNLTGDVITSTGIKKKMGGWPAREWFVRVEAPATVFTDYDVLSFPSANQVQISGSPVTPVSYSILYTIPEHSDFYLQNFEWASSFRNDTTGESVNTVETPPLMGKFLKIKVILNTFVTNTIYSVVSRLRTQERGLK